MSDFIYENEEESEVKTIVYDLLASDYIREVIDYNLEFLAFISEEKNDEQLDQAFLKIMSAQDLAYIKKENLKPGFRDEHLQMIFTSQEYNILFAITDVIYISEKENYSYELLKKGENESIINNIKKTQGYLDLFLNIEKYNEEIIKYKNNFPKDLDFKQMLRKKPEIEVHAIAKLEKDKLFYLICTQSELDRKPTSFSKGQLFLYDSEDLLPLNVIILPNISDFGLSYRKSLLDYLTK